eukprot:1713578-Rhodomonas_salina.1
MTQYVSRNPSSREKCTECRPDPAALDLNLCFLLSSSRVCLRTFPRSKACIARTRARQRLLYCSRWGRVARWCKRAGTFENRGRRRSERWELMLCWAAA